MRRIQLHRPGNDDRSRAAVSRSLRDREAHLPGRTIPDITHRVERFLRRPGTHHDRLSPQVTALLAEHRPQRTDDFRSFREPAQPHASGGQPPRHWADKRHAAAPKHGRVRLGGRVLPHLPVHRWRDKQRCRRREGRERDHVASLPVRQVRQAIRSSWRDDHRVGPPGDLHVRLRFARGEHIDHDFAPAERLEYERRDELRGCRGHHDFDRGTRLAQFAAEVGRLVAGDGARHTKHDVAAREREARRRSSSFHLAPTVLPGGAPAGRRSFRKSGAGQ